MANLKEELVKATERFDAVKIMNEAAPMTLDDIAKELGTTPQNIYRGLTNGMGKVYKALRKDHKANPAQIMKILMNFLDADPEEVLSYLGPDIRKEVEDYIRANAESIKKHGIH